MAQQCLWIRSAVGRWAKRVTVEEAGTTRLLAVLHRPET